MAVAQVVTNEQLNQVLENSIHQQQRLTLTHNGPSGWRIYRSQFVDGSPSSHMILVKPPILHEGPPSELPKAGDTLGVTFRSGHKKCMFGTTLESVERGAGGGMASLRWPEMLQQLQRRAYQRVPPPRDMVIAVRFWREESSSGTVVEARTVYHGQLEDLSVGGIRMRVANPKQIQPGIPYRCAFSPRPGKPALVVDALVRHREAAGGGRTAIGLQFVGLETTLQGRRTLDRLARTVHQFQRARPRG